jgi:hypothetical protein
MVERALRDSGHEALFLAESRPDLQGSLGQLRNRVALDGCPPWRVGPQLEMMPRLNLARHQLRVAASLI